MGWISWALGYNNNIEMQMAELNYEISAEQVETRDIAELYLRIQENTQFLTNIIRHQHGRVFKPFTYDIPNIQLKSFYNLIVQSAYLLYTCYVKKVSLFFSKGLFIAFQKEGGVEIIMEFLLEKQWARLDENRKREIQSNFSYINPFKYENAYADSVLNLMKGYFSLIREYIKRQKDKKLLTDRNKQLQTLQNATALLSTFSQKGIRPKVLITCLQETEVFRTYSYLLKTLNCSIYEAIRKTGKFDQIIQEIKRKQLIFNEGFNSMIRQNMLECESLQNCMEDFISFLIEKGLIETEISVKSKSTSLDSMKDKTQIKIGACQILKQGKHEDRVYVWKILVEEKRMKEWNQKIIQELTEGETTTIYSSEEGQKVQNLLHVEYMAKRNLISVEYISGIEVSIENTDALIFHCNNMMLELNNVTVEHIERQSAKNKRKERVLAFKVTTHLNPKENPFINILLMIDRALIYGKVCEPEIIKKVTRVEDYSRFTVVAKRINHLSNLFIKKVRRLYEIASLKGKQ